MSSTKTSPDLPIVFEDNHLLIIDKPHGVLSQEDHTGDLDVLSLCKNYLSRNTTTAPFLGLVHRLDRPVGGLMMLAKTPQAAKEISQQINDRLVQKTYHAIVFGQPPTNGVLTHHLVKDRQKNIVEAVAESRDSKRAVLSFATLKKQDDLTLLSVHLQTGRPHQIRVQLATEGFPVWGDYKYGVNQPDGREIALRAVELIFKHPSTKKEMHFNLPSPKWEPWNRF